MGMVHRIAFALGHLGSMYSSRHLKHMGSKGVSSCMRHFQRWEDNFAPYEGSLAIRNPRAILDAGFCCSFVGLWWVL